MGLEWHINETFCVQNWMSPSQFALNCKVSITVDWWMSITISRCHSLLWKELIYFALFGVQVPQGSHYSRLSKTLLIHKRHYQERVYAHSFGIDKSEVRM